MKKLVSVLLALALALGVCGAFAESAALPAYTYQTEDPIVDAVVKYMQKTDFGFEAPEGGILVPTPIILRTAIVVAENGEDTDATVYGNFWIFTYALEGKTLKTHSGGENPGVLKLEKRNGEWAVTGAEFAEDGEGYAESIKKFADGDEQLEEAYYDTTGASENSMLPQYQRAVLVNYVAENKLDITDYQDFGQDPVSLID